MSQRMVGVFPGSGESSGPVRSGRVMELRVGPATVTRTAAPRRSRSPAPARRSDAPGPCVGRSRQGGFTRWEVTAILLGVTLLLFLGLPSLARTRSRSESAECLANQRRLINAFLLYAQENQDRLVGTDYRPPGGAPVPLTGGGFWPGADVRFGMTPQAALEAVREGQKTGPLWPFLLDADVIHCPADPRASTLVPGRGWAFDSYSKSEGMGTGLWEGITAFKRVAEVPKPASSFVFCEEPDPRGQNRGTWLINVGGLRFGIQYQPSWVDPLAAFHDGGAWFAMLDGHSEFRLWQDPRSLRTAKRAMAGADVFYAPGGDASNPDFRWVWDRFQHAAWSPLP